MSSSALDDDTREPRRWMNKQEAVRHLLHTSIRLIQAMEDPFAIHLLIHSADKILIDLAKRRGQELKVDWELYIKDEYHAAFFKKMRATYNYLKHADEDFDEKLPIYDIMMINVTSLFFGIANYVTLFHEQTDHMTLFQVFMLHIWPQMLKPEALAGTTLLKDLSIAQGMTPSAFFEMFEKNQGALPRYNAERSKDLEDIVDFYHLSFHQIRMGEKKSTRIFRIPEY
jgi:hypothetical protein